MDPAPAHERAPLTGDPPNPINPPSGCRFHTRCPFAEAVCGQPAPVARPGRATITRRLPHGRSRLGPLARGTAVMTDTASSRSRPARALRRRADGPGRQRRRLRPAARRGARHPRRIRLRQERDARRCCGCCRSDARRSTARSGSTARRPGAAAGPARGAPRPTVSMIFQEPMLALDPVFTIGDQIAEAVQPARGHRPRRGGEARARTAGAGAHSRRRSAGSRPIRTSCRAACASAR